MKKKEKIEKIKGERGVSLVVVLILTIALGMIVASLLSTTSVEAKNTQREVVRRECVGALESVLNSGVGKLMKRWGTTVTITANDLASTPLMPLPTELTSLLANTNIQTGSIQLIGGPVSGSSSYYINPSDPKNANDPQKGMYVNAQNVTLYGRVRANMPGGSTYTAYGSMTLQVRDTPLLAYATFYNMDMEFYTYTLSVHGPVFTNGNFYVQPQTTLYFYDPVGIAGKYYHAVAPGGNTMPLSGTVYYKNGDGNWVSDYRGSGSLTAESSYYDSLDSNFGNIALSRWNGNLNVGATGATKQQMPGFQDYVRDNPATGIVDDALNYGYALIEPNLKVRNGTTGGVVNSPNAKGDAEQLKIARKAGLIVRIHKTTSAPAGITSYKLSTNYYVSFWKLQKGSSNPFDAATVDAGGYITEVNVTPTAAAVTSFLAMKEYTANGGGNNITSGFWDLRMGKGIDALEFDVSQFRKLVDDTAVGYSAAGWNGSYTPANDYNGVVYFEYPVSSTSLNNVTRADKVVVSNVLNGGLVLKNGSVVPAPSYNNGSGRTQGFTIGTNNSMYIYSNFNADGNLATGTSQAPDNAGSPNPAVALAADAITVLSSNFEYVNSNSVSRQNITQPVTTEVCAALIGGIVPTGKGGASIESGGVNNLTRFLETWPGNVTFRLRGAIVCLYESEIATQPWSLSYYSPPVRDYGFYQSFANGTYPPGMPNVRGMRKLKFNLMTEAEYNAAVGGL